MSSTIDAAYDGGAASSEVEQAAAGGAVSEVHATEQEALVMDEARTAEKEVAGTEDSTNQTESQDTPDSSDAPAGDAADKEKDTNPQVDSSSPSPPAPSPAMEGAANNASGESESAPAAEETTTTTNPSPPSDGASDPSAPKPSGVRMRYLVDVEREETEKMREALYPEPEKTEAENYFDVTDLLQRAREDKKEILDAISKPAGEKAKEFRHFAARLAEPQNRDVAQGFVIASAAMMGIPLIVLMFGMKVVAPFFNVNDGLCGGLMAVASTIVIVVLYAMRALREEGVIGNTPKPYANGDSPQTVASSKKQQ